MADFISVIRRAVDGLSNNTPEMRAKVYEKARSAVARQLENMSPRPPEEMLRRQMDKLEAAIQEVEAEHIEALPEEPEAALLEEELGIAPAAPAHAEPEPEPEVEPEPEPEAEPEPQPEPEPETYDEPVAEEDHAAHELHHEPAEEQAEEEAAAEVHEEPAAPVSTVYAAETVEDEHAEPPAEEHAEPAYHYEEAEPEHVAWGAEGEHATAPVEEVYPGEPWPHAAEEQPAEVEAEEPVASAEPEGEQPVAAAEPEVEETVEEEPTPAAPAAWTESVPDYDRTYGDWVENAREEETSHEVEAPETAAAPPAPTMPEAPVEPWQTTDEPQPEETPTAAPAAKVASHDIDLLDWDTTAYQPPAGVDGSKGGEAQNFDDFADWYAAVATPAAGAALEAGETAEGQKAARANETAAITGGTVPPAEKVPGKPYRIEQTKRRNYAPIAVGVLVVAALAGGGYELWANRDAVTTFVGDSVASLTAMVAGKGTETTTPPPAETATNETSPTTAAPPEAGAETKAPDAKAPTSPEEGAATGQKFTQRLLADGTEVDEGAGTVAANAGTEGRSVSEQNVAGTQPSGQAGATAGGPAAGTTATPPVDMSKPVVGEKAFLYEEKLGQTSPTAITGAVEWTALNDTSENGRPNPAIQGKLSIPDRGLSALITIKRNADNSLPASHLIEVVFSVPADFEGGAIDSVQRIAMKRTEQDRGDPLVAVSAKITDDSYLIALNDFQDVVARNLDLLRTRNWIDIPVTYRNGRRALLTLDKGTAGVAVFDEVLKQWTALDNGNSGG